MSDLERVRERDRKGARERREADPEKARERARKYRAANLEKERERDRKRRARKKAEREAAEATPAQPMQGGNTRCSSDTRSSLKIGL
jgi:hypothetical protein